MAVGVKSVAVSKNNIGKIHGQNDTILSMRMEINKRCQAKGEDNRFVPSELEGKNVFTY